MNQKPLSKERREEIEFAVSFNVSPDNPLAWKLQQLLKDVAAAEQFWREAVKNAPETDGNDFDGMGRPSCVFCDATEAYISGQPPSVPHKSECPWLLAQEA